MTLHFSSGEQTAWRASKYKLQMASLGFSDRPSYHKILMCVCTHTCVFVCEEYIHIHVHPYTIMNYIIYMNVCVHTYMYVSISSPYHSVPSHSEPLFPKLHTSRHSALWSEAGRRNTLWLEALSLFDRDTYPSNSCREPLPKSLLSTVSQWADEIH